MTHPIILSASILSADFSQLGAQIHEAEQAGVDWIHVDVMDGHFVPNITMGPFIVKTCRRITCLPLDVHLMIEKPERYLEAFVAAGASYLTVHIETCPHIHHTLQTIRALGCHPSVVVNPGTSLTQIEEVLHLVDMVLIMSVNPGASGQTFLPESVAKIAKLQAMLANYPSVIIEVDGGITTATLPSTYAAGARAYVSASAIFGDPAGIAHGIASLRESANK